jgi:hypothetical protein
MEAGAQQYERGAFEQALGALDTSLFDHVPTQTSESDRRSLLALHHACREVHGSFAYLEIGSHLGGSLQAFLADARCTSIVSIDPRPARQPDTRGTFDYPDNTTARMLEHLASVPGAELGKLHTIEASTADVSPRDLPARPRLCLIDGEHTNEAALRDGRFCLEAVDGDGAIVFHDRRLVRGAIKELLDELAGVAHRGYPLMGSVYVVEAGEAPLLPAIRDALGPEEPGPFLLLDHPARVFPPP